MARGLAALVCRRASLEALADADHELELSRNEQLARTPPDTQQEHRDRALSNISKRLQILRRNLGQSFLIMASAVVVGLAFRLAAGAHLPSPRFTGAGSLFLFAWATLGRLGWAGQSYKGNSIIERLDERLFRVLYWLGTFLGTIALL
jgi:hypothetical protein